jgi:hypothetical protein
VFPQPTAPEVLSTRETVAPSLTSFEGQPVEGTPMRSPSGLVIPLPWGYLDTFCYQ